jgi:hypothetical protein
MLATPPASRRQTTKTSALTLSHSFSKASSRRPRHVPDTKNCGGNPRQHARLVLLHLQGSLPQVHPRQVLEEDTPAARIDEPAFWKGVRCHHAHQDSSTATGARPNTPCAFVWTPCRRTRRPAPSGSRRRSGVSNSGIIVDLTHPTPRSYQAAAAQIASSAAIDCDEIRQYAELADHKYMLWPGGREPRGRGLWKNRRACPCSKAAPHNLATCI